MRWPWESEADYKARLNAKTKRIQARQESKAARTQARQGGRTDRIQAKADGGLYSAESVAARQGTVQAGLGAVLSAGEGVAQAFGYDVELDGDASVMPTAMTAPTSTSNADGTVFGLDRTTVLIAGVGIVALMVVMGRRS